MENLPDIHTIENAFVSFRKLSSIFISFNILLQNRLAIMEILNKQKITTNWNGSLGIIWTKEKKHGSHHQSKLNQISSFHFGWDRNKLLQKYLPTTQTLKRTIVVSKVSSENYYYNVIKIGGGRKVLYNKDLKKIRRENEDRFNVNDKATHDQKKKYRVFIPSICCYVTNKQVPHFAHDQNEPTCIKHSDASTSYTFVECVWCEKKYNK